MSGKAAAFGGRMMNSVADQMLKQFADNFAAQVQRARRRRAAAPAAAPAARGAAARGAGSRLGRRGAERPRAARGRIFKDWLRGLFRKKTA